MISIVIPAHNEQTTIGRCLDRLLAGAADGELDVIVVPNGCTDDTAAVAAAHQGVRVIELQRGSKPLALNAGDAAATGWPRFYLDADVELDIDGVRAVAAALAEPGVLAASTGLDLRTDDSTWVVRAYHRIWRDLPSIRDGLAGRGNYALSADGRARFDAFPDLVSDDGFVDGIFSPGERRSVSAVTSTVYAPRTTGELVARKSRSIAGGAELHAAGNQRSQSDTAWLRVVRRHPARVFDVPAYVGVTLAARRRARRLLAADQIDWSRDESSR